MGVTVFEIRREPSIAETLPAPPVIGHSDRKTPNGIPHREVHLLEVIEIGRTPDPYGKADFRLQTESALVNSPPDVCTDEIATYRDFGLGLRVNHSGCQLHNGDCRQ